MLLSLLRLEEQANLGHAGTRNALLPQNDVLHFLTGILEGLVYMHKNEVAHRDLKVRTLGERTAKHP